MLVREFIRCLKTILFIYLLSVFDCAGSLLLGRFFSSCNELGPLVVVHRLHMAVASLAANHRLQSIRGSVVAAPGPQHTGSVAVAHGLNCFAACRIFLDEGLNMCVLHWQADPLPLRHQGNPLFKKIIIYIFGCAKDLQLRHANSLLVACGISFPDQELNWAPSIGSMVFQPLDPQVNPLEKNLISIIVLSDIEN